MIPTAERARIISEYLEKCAKAPKQRECWACGRSYEGSRMICGDAHCLALWQEKTREIERRHPQSRPSGAIFFLDYQKGLDNKAAGDGSSR